jgi:GNAT superfamily N-acetyltransferase
MRDHNISTGSTAASAAIPRAIEAFVHGFGFTRSFTHPYLAERVGPLWVMRDAPRKRGDYRSEEWVAYGMAPEDVNRTAREQTRGRFAVCLICSLNEPHAPQTDRYKALGYRLASTEPLMVHSLAQIPRFDSPARVERVLTTDLAQRLAKAAGSRQILPEHLSAHARLRQYVAWLDGELVGWVRSIVAGDATWCSNMYVRPEFRRRGIARAMLSQMLHDDRAGGAQSAVLLASHTGAKLYPVVGYEQIGTLFLFTPKKR